MSKASEAYYDHGFIHELADDYVEELEAKVKESSKELEALDGLVVKAITTLKLLHDETNTFCKDKDVKELCLEVFKDFKSWLSRQPTEDEINKKWIEGHDE